jgi:hypothetical protein
VPVQMRERTKSTSLSMPPTLKKQITAHANRSGMSFSEFVTILCANYLKASGELAGAPEHPKADPEEATKERQHHNTSSPGDTSNPAH